MEMEDTFKVRVDKAFGSLQSSSSSSTQPTPSSSSLWSLTDEEIERHKWIQDKVDPHKHTEEDHLHRLKNPKPYSPILQGLLAEPSTSGQNMASDIQDLDDDEDDGEEDENRRPEMLNKPDDHSNEEWDIRSSVGMDCTLDNEEEEDAYDKVAVGKDVSADRFYLKDVNDYDVEIDSNNELPTAITDVTKDPRANHTAAKLRLKEDDDSARKLNLQVSDNNNIQGSNQTATETKDISSSVPDYVRNPSKYTHYTFDSLDGVDEESNRKAYMEFFNSMKGSAAMEIQDDVSVETPKSIIFTPRKKSSDVVMKDSKVDGYEGKKVVPISVADAEVCVMDEDEPEMGTSRSSGLQKGGRRYRTKGGTDLE